MEDKSRPFDRNRLYSRAEIANLLGGGTVQSYMPTKGTRVLAGCFRTEVNPDAPRIVLVGIGPRIERAARLLMEQKEPIPVFLKRASKAYEYVGFWRAIGLL